MSKNYSIYLKIISLIAIISFTFTQLSWGFEGSAASSQEKQSCLRIQQSETIRHDVSSAMASGDNSRVLSTDPSAIRIINSMGSSELPFIVVGPHPDDVEWTTAALQLHLINQGRANIYWSILTTGQDKTGIFDEQVLEKGESADVVGSEELAARKVMLRENETRKAADEIGIQQQRITFHKFGAGARDEDFQTTMGPQQEDMFLEHLKQIAANIPLGQPIALGWPVAEDAITGHANHAYSISFMDRIVKRFINDTGRAVYAVRFRILMGDKNQEHPNTYVVMTPQLLETKSKALACHASQIERRRLQGRTGNIIVESQQRVAENFNDAGNMFPSEDLHDFTAAECFTVYEIKPSDPAQAKGTGEVLKSAGINVGFLPFYITSSFNVYEKYMSGVLSFLGTTGNFNPDIPFCIEAHPHDKYEALEFAKFPSGSKSIHLRQVRMGYNSPLYNINLTDPNTTSLMESKSSVVYDIINAARPENISLHLAYANDHIVDLTDGRPSGEGELLSREEVLARIVNNVTALRTNLNEMGLQNIRVLLENLSYQERDGENGSYNYICEPAFINEVLNATQAGFLIDLSHAFISAQRLPGYNGDYMKYIEELVNENTIGRLREIHISIPEYNPGRDFYFDGHLSFLSNRSAFEQINNMLKYILKLSADYRKLHPDADPVFILFETNDRRHTAATAQLENLVEAVKSANQASAAGEARGAGENDEEGFAKRFSLGSPMGDVKKEMEAILRSPKMPKGNSEEGPTVYDLDEEPPASNSGDLQSLRLTPIPIKWTDVLNALNSPGMRASLVNQAGMRGLDKITIEKVREISRAGYKITLGDGSYRTLDTEEKLFLAQLFIEAGLVSGGNAKAPATGASSEAKGTGEEVSRVLLITDPINETFGGHIIEILKTEHNLTDSDIEWIRLSQAGILSETEAEHIKKAKEGVQQTFIYLSDESLKISASAILGGIGIDLSGTDMEDLKAKITSAMAVGTSL